MDHHVKRCLHGGNQRIYMDHHVKRCLHGGNLGIYMDHHVKSGFYMGMAAYLHGGKRISPARAGFT